MGLEERDYLKDLHYPSCTCVACWRKRSERAAREHWCDRHDRPMGPSGCHLCQQEGVAEPPPDGGQDAPPRDTADGQPAAAQHPAGGDSKTQHGTRLGSLKGMLSRKHDSLAPDRRGNHDGLG